MLQHVAAVQERHRRVGKQPLGHRLLPVAGLHQLAAEQHPVLVVGAKHLWPAAELSRISGRHRSRAAAGVHVHRAGLGIGAGRSGRGDRAEHDPLAGPAVAQATAQRRAAVRVGDGAPGGDRQLRRQRFDPDAAHRDRPGQHYGSRGSESHADQPVARAVAALAVSRHTSGRRRPACSDAGGGHDRVGEEAGHQPEQHPEGKQLRSLRTGGDAEQLADHVHDGAGGQG